MPHKKVKIENNKTKLEKGCTYKDGYLKSNQRDVYVHAYLEKGQYAIITEVDWKI